MTPSSPVPMPAASSQCDVLVIGGGPAGSTAATLLAQKGYDVVMLEKAQHPRFHIGESLLPANLPLLEKLGVAEQVRAVSMEKWAAEFVSPWHEPNSSTFRFADAWDKSMPYSYQVRRSEFDEILFRNAAAKGAKAIEGCRVRDVNLQAGGGQATVMAEHDDGRKEQWTAKFVIDASGRDTVLGKKLGTKERNPKHNSSAIYGHFKNAKRHAGQDEGNITIFWFDHGWFWFIPLADGCTSVGAVVWSYYLKSRKVPVKDFFTDSIAMCKGLSERLAGATLVSDVEVTSNFSYSCTQTHGSNYLLVGDAFAFIDPVFSSGVMLAMQGGFTACDTVHTCLSQPAKAAAALRHYDHQTRRGPAKFSWFIYRVTNPSMRDLFMGPRNVLRVKEALLSLLAGDIFGKTPIWGAVRILKAIYYATCAVHPKRTWQAIRRRKFNIQVLDAEGR